LKIKLVFKFVFLNGDLLIKLIDFQPLMIEFLSEQLVLIFKFIQIKFDIFKLFFFIVENVF